MNPASTPSAQSVHLSLPVHIAPRVYRVSTDIEQYVGNLTYLNKRETQLSLARPQATHVTVNELSFRQTNNEGQHQMDAALSRLRHTLSLKLWANGRIDTIENQPELLTRYKTLRTDWQKQYPTNKEFPPAYLDVMESLFADPDRLLRTLSQAPELELLLPAIYDHAYAYDQPVTGPPAFITPLTGSLVMPLQTTIVRRKPHYPDVALDLMLTGTLDEKQFPFEEARRWLQTLTGVVDIDPTPAIQYILTFEFDRQHTLLHAGRFVTCIYENVAMSKEITQVGPATSATHPAKS